jgi:hypothetical protein
VTPAATEAGGFNPMAPGQQGAPGADDGSGGGGAGENRGPSPAAQRGAQAEAIRKLIKTYAPDAKDLHTATKGMSVDQLEGMLKGYALKQAGAEQAARVQDWQAQARMRDQQVQDDQTVGKLLKAYGTFDPGTDDEGNALVASPGERMQFALKQVPEAGGRVLPKAVDALTRYEQLLNPKAGEDLTAHFEEDPVTGARFYRSGKTSIGSGFNPGTSQAKDPVAHFDEDGKVTGFSTWDSKKGYVFKPAKGDSGLKQATLQDGTVVPGFVVDGNGKMHDVRSAMEKALGASAAPAAGASGAASGVKPLPKSKDELVKGEQYQTARGPALWNGTKFVK